MSIVFIGLGSNVGDRADMIGQALILLEQTPDITCKAVSPLYESPAMLPPDAPDDWNMPFLNGVAALETGMMAHTLLEILHGIECALGRERQAHWSPRTIDLDVLAYDDHVLATPALTLPHPGVLTRDFVLLPWRDITPDWQYPVPGPHHGETIAQLCDRLGTVTAQQYTFEMV